MLSANTLHFFIYVFYNVYRILFIKILEEFDANLPIRRFENPWYKEFYLYEVLLIWS